MANISNILSSTQIALEKQAADKFGAAVDDFVRGSLGIGADASPGGQRIKTRDPSTWYASSYAAALAGGTDYRPKLKFLFKVEFKFKAGVLDSLASGGLLDSKTREAVERNEFTFMIKTVDRPKVDFEYEEDVNQYNFRTKVLKKIRHRPLTMVFMDDAGNRVFDFFRVLVMLYSPITRRQMARDGTTRKPDTTSAQPGNGMEFSSPNIGDNIDISHRGVINASGFDTGQALDVIRVKQMFMNPAASNLNDAPSEVIFDFMNPRLEMFDLEELSHEASDPSTLTMQFDYDWMEMVKVSAMQAADTPVYNISVKGVTGAPSDVLSGKNLPQDGRTGTNPIPAATSTNPFLAIINRQVGRAVQQVTSDTINRAVRSTFGTGRFATDLGGRISGSLGGVLGGLTQAAGRSLIAGQGSSPVNNSARATQAVVSDAATVGSDTPLRVASSSTAYQTTNPAPDQG